MTGAFVRALGTVFHLNCFKCMARLDCGDVVAQKFFPIEGQDGKQQPLCERDYFRRLNLICAKCGLALRGSYITACNKKFHVEHFTCSICPTHFGPQDSYYEHDGDVYCHYHYSTRFATKCAGCNTAILKQFVEINRNMKDECWHPECYMINKFWNVKVVTKRPASLEMAEQERTEPPYVQEEREETAVSLKDKQVRMEQQVISLIFSVLSAFEESSAACISDMLRQVSNGNYLEAIRMAEKFILHVEVLFATIDDLEWSFARLNLKSPSHVREARMLCRKTVDLFTLLSHTQETGARRMGMTQELLALVTGLAHYLKILIRIALTGALKLEREHGMRDAMASFLDKLHLLAVQGGNPSARRMMKGAKGEVIPAPRPGAGVNAGTTGVTYGFRSLAPENAGESPFLGSPRDPALTNVPVVNSPSDLCVKCNQTVEEDCVRLGTYQRWHSHCVTCKTCGKIAAVPAPPADPTKAIEDKEKDVSAPTKISTVRRPPANVDWFVYELDSIVETPNFGAVPTVIYCTEHGHSNCRAGFQAVSRLEQYAFLLNVALRRLYLLLKRRKVIPLTPTAGMSMELPHRPLADVRSAPPTQPTSEDVERDPYRNSGDTMRMKTDSLNRKLSATARLPKLSTVVESPTGKIAHPTDVVTGHRGQHHDGPRPQAAQHAQARPSPPGQYQPPPSQQGSSRTPPGQIDTSQLPRPALSRKNTDVMIVDDPTPAPLSPAVGYGESALIPAREGITLADIPQLAEAAQAMEQHRSLPRQNARPFIAELSPLELAIVKHAAVVILYRSALREQFELDELLEMVETKKSGFWNKIFKQDKKKIAKKGVFGVPLELLVEREGADSLHGASRETLRVPSFIDDVVSAMRQMDMSVEGIFRKNGNIKRLNELVEVIDRDPSSVDLTTDNPVQLAALLKRFLRELPDPLLTFRLHKLLIVSQNPRTIPNEAERKRLLHMLMLILPKAHRDTLEVLFVFLKWVASFAHLDERTGSKMDLPNLATVICPSILYSQGRDALRDESFGAIPVVTALLENQDEFYNVPEEFLPILEDQQYFANCMELPGKEFMKKVETYMRLKASGRQLGTMSPIVGAAPSNLNDTSGSHHGRMVEQSDSAPERPGLPPSAQSELVLRNGYPQPPRPQQPGLQHSPVSYPPPGQPSLGQQSAIMQVPQPRPPPNGHAPLNDWTVPPRPPVLQPPSRPTSASYGRASGELVAHAHTNGNGHGMAQAQHWT
ncbi:hypothetical protein K488DRAFT_58020 [Vararia minispora EC-137]|uniref:Uncharacterized protein n=1 Tax=Vararia minispora EC-137 TaxID=1314806 RepID=A0ACB8QAP3_9AGAM|nr:hypothetical protein K488DRAFT_58020 [Vararia minispora EC-137]